MKIPIFKCLSDRFHLHVCKKLIFSLSDLLSGLAEVIINFLFNNSHKSCFAQVMVFK
jgi:hypothetical protein